MVVPLRVGDSFVADVNRFAQAVLYAIDNGVSVVQEALGTLNNSRLARQAIDYAYEHGVTVIASAADEAAAAPQLAGRARHPRQLVTRSTLARSTTDRSPAQPAAPLLPAVQRLHELLEQADRRGPELIVLLGRDGRGAGMAGLHLRRGAQRRADRLTRPAGAHGRSAR